MQTRTHQGFTFSTIGVGCYALSGAYGPKDQARVREVICRAHELGVTYFDTADAYGEAEQFLGETIRPFRSQVKIATKVGVKEGNQLDLSAEHVIEACENSLRKLGTETIDLHQVHFDDHQTPVEETVGALEKLVETGKIRRYGLGHLPLERVEAYCRIGKPLSILMELSAVGRDSQRTLLPLCRKHPVGAIAFSVTGRGLLTGKITAETRFDPGDIRQIDPLFQRERLTSGLRVAARLQAIGARYEMTPAQAAIAWVLAQPGVVCALTGPSTVAHLEENLRAAAWAFPEEELKGFNAWLEEEDRRLGEAQAAVVRQILDEPLAEDAGQAFKDLVYVIETAIVQGLAAEAELMPVFMRLFGMRKDLSQDAMGEIQQELRGRVGPNPPAPFPEGKGESAS